MTDTLPSEAELLEFISNFQGKVTKREIARAYGIKGYDKVPLKHMIRDMIDRGILAQDQHRELRPSTRLPSVQIVEFAGIDKNGEALVRPVNTPNNTLEGTSENTPAPIIYLHDQNKRGKGRTASRPAMGHGDRALARLIQIKTDPPTYRAEIIKNLQNAPQSILGVFKGSVNGGNINPVDKKDRHEYLVTPENVGKAADGDLVLAEPVRRGRRTMGPRMARVREVIGDVSSARTISMIAVHAHDIPHEFPDHVLKAAKKAAEASSKGRTDLRNIPLITIDPIDARDHDDAIWAETDPDPKNKNGWHVIVAIADVAHYVPSGSALDTEAYKRGNSCYFPDRVIPMLPEALSAGLCSLQPNKDRACMAVHMWFNASGQKLRHKFERGIMKSHGNIDYRAAQAALDGTGDETANALLDCTLKPLLGAYEALIIARANRAPLELDLAERKIILDSQGYVADILVRERLTTHKIVEEMMIMANVCAAEELEKHRTAVMYRVHDEPPMDKMELLRDFLKSLDLKITKGAVLMPRMFNGVLKTVRNTPQEDLVNQIILRSQTQAYYGPENLGHFGLALPRYAHFTSPIRRYSDLLVHRGLIKALGFGPDGLKDEEANRLVEMGEHISKTERRAMTAERDSTDRYLAHYLAENIGDIFKGRISGVNRFGLFVALQPSGGDGLIPISAIGPDYYYYNEAKHSIKGKRYGQYFTLGDVIDVRLVEVNKYTGGLRLELIPSDDLPKNAKKPSKGKHKNLRRSSSNQKQQLPHDRPKNVKAGKKKQ